MVAVAYGSGRLRELFNTKFKSQFKRGFTKVVLTGAGRLREWSQGELQLYYLSRLSRAHFFRQAFLEVAVYKK